jgi:hypothetical protein
MTYLIVPLGVWPEAMAGHSADRQVASPLSKEEHMRIRKFFVALMMAAAPTLAFADTSDFIDTVPEPATLALLGVGVAAWLISRKNKRK